MKALAFAAIFALAAGAAPANAATQINVEDIGAILNQSLALPAQDTPGSSIGFAQFFEIHPADSRDG